MNEAIACAWSSCQLDRQISTLYYERLLSSADKEPVKEEAVAKLNGITDEQYAELDVTPDFDE